MKTTASITTGTRNINGTDWPIEDVLDRVALPGRRTYGIITRGVCNGAGSGVERHSTRRSAIDAL